jgi:vacuolar iron transporter family protein
VVAGQEDDVAPATRLSNRLRAAVLGATDGIVSNSALTVGVAAAATTREPVLLATIAAVLAGAGSIAVSEYVSVSSARDAQQADLDRERREHEQRPHLELVELATMFEERGASPETARAMAEELSQADALAAHAREELGLTEELAARPLEASASSAAAFLAGGSIPIIAILVAPLGVLIPSVAVATAAALVLLGLASAAVGGANRGRAILRIVTGGMLAMAVTAVGSLLLGIEL